MAGSARGSTLSKVAIIPPFFEALASVLKGEDAPQLVITSDHTFDLMKWAGYTYCVTSAIIQKYSSGSWKRGYWPLTLTCWASECTPSYSGSLSAIQAELIRRNLAQPSLICCDWHKASSAAVREVWGRSKTMLKGLEHLFRNVKKQARKKLQNRGVQAFLCLVRSLMWAPTPMFFHVLLSTVLARVRQHWCDAEFARYFESTYCQMSKIPEADRQICGLSEMRTARWNCHFHSRAGPSLV